MPSDMVAGDERREIAADLRMAAEQGQPYTEPTLACFVRADRLSSIWDRLASLIEPEKSPERPATDTTRLTSSMTIARSSSP